jgi:large subunit ribosomal protein L30
MSTKPKGKAKAKAPRKEKTEKPKAVRKRRAAEVTKKEVVPEKKIERPEKVAKVVAPPPEKPLVLVVRLLGEFGAPQDIQNSLTSLRLNNKFRAILLEKNDSMLGALRKVKDYVTWGEVKSSDVATLLKKRAELSNGMVFSDKFVRDSFGRESVEELAQAITRGQLNLKSLWQKGVVPVFRLHPPSGAFVGSIKRPFGSRGELGYRGADISNLMARML